MNASNKQPARFRFSIVAGSLKGRVITAPDLGITRPPLTRVRRSIFDFLNPHLDGRSYLDLFSGTGSYLFEAISRGAETALGIESESRLVDSINSQAEAFSISDRLTCRCDDVFAAIPRLNSEGRTFDIVMIAPPQYRSLIDQTLKTLRELPIVTTNGLILCQHDTSETRIDFGSLPIEQIRKYGNTAFTILRP